MIKVDKEDIEMFEFLKDNLDMVVGLKIRQIRNFDKRLKRMIEDGKSK